MDLTEKTYFLDVLEGVDHCEIDFRETKILVRFVEKRSFAEKNVSFAAKNIPVCRKKYTGEIVPKALSDSQFIGVALEPCASCWFGAPKPRPKYLSTKPKI